MVAAVAGGMSSGMAYMWMRKIGMQVHSSIKPLYFGIFIASVCIVSEIIIEIFFPEFNKAKN